MPDDHRPDDQRPDDRNPDHPGKEGEFDGITQLYIRTHPADDGSEPLPSGLAFWTSPDIWVVRPGGAVGGEAVPLELNHVRVTVTNAGGLPAVDAWLEVWVADPSTLITPTTATFVAGDFVTVQGYQQTTVDLPWTPLASDSGHRCLVARVGLVLPPDTYDDPTVFDVIGDRHVAQRNIQVLEVPAGKAMTFRFRLGAPEGQREVLVRAVERTREMTTAELVRAGGCEGGLPAQVPLAGLGVRALTAREAAGRPSLQGDLEVPLGVARRADAVPERSELRADLVRARLPRVGALTFEVSPDDEPGRLHAVDVVQLDERSGEPIGGLTFVVRVT